MRERILAATGWLPRLIARIPASVHAKLLLAFLATAALLIILGAVGLKVLSGVNSRAEDLVKRQERIGAYRQFQHDVSLPSSWSWNERTLSATLAQLNQFRYEFDQLQVVAMDDTDRLGRVRDDYEQLTAAVGQVVQLIDAGASVESRKSALLKASALADRLDRLTNELVNRAEADLVTRMDASQAAYATSRSVVIGFAVGSLALALVLGYAISWSLIGPVQLMDARLRRVASGDFSQRLDVPNRDELGVLARQFNQMTAQLQGSYAALEEKTGALGQAVEELTALGEVSRAVSSTLDLETVLETIVARSVHISATAGGSIYEYDEGTDTLHLRATYNMDAELVELLRAEPIRLGEGSAGKAAALRAPVQVADIRDDTLYDASRLRGPLGRHGYRALLSVPLFLEQRVLGTLTVWRRQPGAFTPEVVNLLQTFATHSALALQNARLFQELADKSRQLEVANRHKSEFVAGMSHELRTPLNAIIGYSEMLQEEAQDLDQPVFIPDLRKINTAGKHLLQLINAVLDLSKIEAGKMELYVERFDVPALVEEIGAVIEPLADKKGNRLVVSCASDAGEMRTDQTKVRQVLFNLLSNACKFTEQGTVTLTVRRDGGSQRAQSPRVLFEVADSGIGMTDEEMSRLFQDFTQADATTARRFGGTGLGLALSRRLCRMMGGDITVTSEQGRGSTFTMTLPAEAPAAPGDASELAEAMVPAQEGGPPAPAGTVLVIDDEPAAREIIARSLGRDGFRVRTAATGDEGLRLARAIAPDVITLDVLMPGMDGWAVLAALKADPRLADIPVVMVTILEEKNRGYALGAADYLVKPLDRDRLMEVVRRHGPQHPVLVVDDDPEVRGLIRRVLEREGHVVVEAENGLVGLACARERQPGLVLLDLVMPQMDGFDFLEAFRREGAFRAVPVVVVTARDLTGDDRTRLASSVERVLDKRSQGDAGWLGEVRDLVASLLRRGPGPSP